MRFSIDITDDDIVGANGSIEKRHQAIRAAAYFLLHTIGDLQDEATPTAPSVAPAAMAPAVNTAVASAAVNTSTIPPAPTVSAPAYNVPLPPEALTRIALGLGSPEFHIPPPPPPNVPPPPSNDEDEGPTSFPTAGTVPPPPLVTTAAILAPSGNAAMNAGAATDVVSGAEYDSAGMPWDARIHQKAKGKKKDNTWKLIKGIDTAIVQAVTAELAARKGASAPVSLPPTSTGSNSMPVPPVANVPAPPGVSSSPASAPVPVPPPPAVGVAGASPYRALIDKITALTKAGKLAPAKVAEICQSHGAPSLMALNGMQAQMSARDPGLTVIQAVDKDVDAAALGLL